MKRRDTFKIVLGSLASLFAAPVLSLRPLTWEEKYLKIWAGFRFPVIKQVLSAAGTSAKIYDTISYDMTTGLAIPMDLVYDPLDKPADLRYW